MTRKINIYRTVWPFNGGIYPHRMLIDLGTERVGGVRNVWTNPIREGVSVEGLTVKMIQIIDAKLNRRVWIERWRLEDMEHVAIPNATLRVIPGDAEWPPVQILEVEASEMWEGGKELCVD